MKNVVFGMFDERDDARRVLRQLADSPLDLDTVQIVHSDPDVQFQLASEIGLPPDRAMPTGLLIGALLGAALGAYSGSSWLASLGPLLAASGGLLVGAVAGAVIGAVAETIRLPDQSSAALVSAVDSGGTAILVRTSNLPTARAISDLFYAGGARSLPRADEGDGGEDLSLFAPRAASVAVGPGLAVGEPLETHPSLPSAPDSAPPSQVASPAVDEAASTETMEDPLEEDGEQIFAPPWRRTPFAMRPNPSAAAPPITPLGDEDATALPEDGGNDPDPDSDDPVPTS